MLQHQKVWGSKPRNYADYGENELQEVFSIVHDILSKMNLIGRFGVMQSDVHFRMVVELSAVKSSM